MPDVAGAASESDFAVATVAGPTETGGGVGGGAGGGAGGGSPAVPGVIGVGGSAGERCAPYERGCGVSA